MSVRVAGLISRRAPRWSSARAARGNPPRRSASCGGFRSPKRLRPGRSRACGTCPAVRRSNGVVEVRSGEVGADDGVEKRRSLAKAPLVSEVFQQKKRHVWDRSHHKRQKQPPRFFEQACACDVTGGERRTWWLHAGVFRTSALFTRCPPTKIWNVMSLRRLRMERMGTVSGGRGRIARPECRGRKRRENRGTRRQGPGRTTRDEPCHPNAPPTRPRRPCLTARTARDRRRTDERRSRALSSGSASRRRFVHCC